MSARVECTTTQFALSGTVIGLLGTGLQLGNGLTVLAPTADGTFSLGSVASGAGYNVTVTSQPVLPSQTCVVDHGAGTVGAEAIKDVRVSCTTNSYLLGGNVTGLAGTGLKLRATPGGDVDISANGTFDFPTRVSSGTSYSIEVIGKASSPAQSCALVNASGVIGSTDARALTVTCTTDRFAYIAGHDVNALLAFTIDGNDGSLTRIDPFQTFPIGSLPRAIIMDASRTFLYASSAGSGTISGFRIDPVTGLLSSLPGSPYAAGAEPVHMALDNTGRYLYVTNYTPGTISGFQINSTTGVLTPLAGSPFTAGAQPAPIFVDPQAARLYAINMGDQSLTHYTIANDGALSLAAGSISAGFMPFSMAFDAANRRIYSVDWSWLNAHHVQPDGSLVSEHYTADAPGERIVLHPDEPYAFMTSNGVSKTGLYVYALDPSTGAPTLVGTGPAATGPNPSSIAIHPNGSYIYVTDDVAHAGPAVRVYRLDRTNGTLTPLPTPPTLIGGSFGAILIR
jgi:6-phosphogluconolactonase (cycloisomerase 2 family)